MLWAAPTARPLRPRSRPSATTKSFRSVAVLFSTSPPHSPSPPHCPPPPLPYSITDRVFLDLSLCASYFQSRTLGEYDLSLCTDSELVGCLVLGLYGNLLPITVSNFKSTCTGSAGSSYKGTLIHKIFPGEFFAEGLWGRKDKGEVTPPGLEILRPLIPRLFCWSTRGLV